MTDIFARNFDFDVVDPEVTEGDDAGGGPAMIPVVEADMLAEKARTAGYEEGLIAGAANALAEERGNRSARSDDALISLAHGLSDLVTRDRRLRAEVELEMAEILTDIGERLLPDLFDAHIADILVARINSAIQFASGEGQVSIRVPPELADDLTPKLNTLLKSVDHDGVHFRIITDPQIEDATIRMDWRNGFMQYDPAFASEEALNTLKEAVFELKSQLESIP